MWIHSRLFVPKPKRHRDVISMPLYHLTSFILKLSKYKNIENLHWLELTSSRSFWSLKLRVIGYNTTFYLNITIHFSLHLPLFCLFLFTCSYSLSFLSLSPFLLSTNIYLNITIHLSFHLSLFRVFLFTLSYYKFVILSSIFYIVFPHKKVSLSLSLNFLVDFQNSNLSWCDIVVFYFILFFLYC